VDKSDDRSPELSVDLAPACLPSSPATSRFVLPRPPYGVLFRRMAALRLRRHALRPVGTGTVWSRLHDDTFPNAHQPLCMATLCLDEGNITVHSNDVSLLEQRGEP